jgi:hypothetical protein
MSQVYDVPLPEKHRFHRCGGGDGSKVDPFMPFEAYGKMNDTEKRAIWACLQGLPPKPFGER